MRHIERLTAIYKRWCAANNLPYVSAGDHDHETLTESQYRYLNRFIAAWDKAWDMESDQ